MRVACLLLVLAACDSPAPAPAPSAPVTPPAPAAGHGFLLVSADARAAGARLDDGTVLGPLPIELGSMPRTVIIGPARVTVDPDATLVTYAFTSDGRRDVLVLDGDVYADRIAVDAPPDAASQLAAALGATAEAGGDGTWILRGDHIWSRAAALHEARGVREIFAVEIKRDGSDSVARRGGAPSTPPAPSPWTPNYGGVPSQPITPGTSVPCEDPIAGTWVARTYRGEALDWYEFTLHIGRQGSALSGTIRARFWEGDASDPKPTATCDDGGPAIGRASMQATGTWSAGKLDFKGTIVDEASAACGVDVPAYSADHFKGKLRNDGVLVTANNDGGSANDRPYLFRRTSCN